MDLQTPPTLVQLAEQSLLRDQDLAISALKDLPRELYPSLFKEAFFSRSSRILRMMVAAWPFPYLPLGSLRKTPDLETMQAVLAGLDDLLTQKVPHRQCKLQVLDLRPVHLNFWGIWAGTEEASSCQQVPTKRPSKTKLLGPRMKQPLKVLAHLSFSSRDLKESQAYLLRWAGRRKSSLELCCEKVEVWPLPSYTLSELLPAVRLDSVQELELKKSWNLRTLARFAPSLGQMRQLRSFFLSGVNEGLHCFDPPCPELTDSYIASFVSQLSNLSCLQHLYMNGLSFLSGHLEQVFGGLKSPLETLAIPDCLLSEQDWEYLSLCPCVGQLRNLDLSGINFFFFPHDCLKVLLGRVAATLQTLNLEGCVMEEFHIHSLLPALSQCSQLTWINLYDNYITIPVLENLLQHTASLSQLTLERYPAPMESYDEHCVLVMERFTHICSQLMDTLRSIRKAKTVYFASVPHLDSYKRFVYHLGSVREQYT